jgi:hypothetical protein
MLQRKTTGALAVLIALVAMGVMSASAFAAGEAPSVATEAAGNVANNEATLHGTVNPNGLETTYHFEYGPGPSETYTKSTTVTSAGSGTSILKEQAHIEGLTKGTSYNVRIVATNSAGTSYGADKRFQAGEPPVATTLAASAIGHFEATLNASVNAKGTSTTYYFEYGTTTGYGSKTPTQSGGTREEAVERSEPIAGLKDGTLYDYRVVAVSAVETVYGANMHFTTSGKPQFADASGNPVGTAIKGASGTVTFKVYGGTITCSKSTTTGTVTSVTAVGKVVLTLTGCKGKKTSGVECEERSEGANPEEIVTKPLKGQLGAVAGKEAASGVGVYLEAESEPSSATWWKTAQVCLPENKQITGTAAAEVVTVGKDQFANELVFAAAEGASKIKKILLASGKTEEPELLSWNSSPSTIEAADPFEFSEKTEVT